MKKKVIYLTAVDMYIQIKNFKFKTKLPLFQCLVLPAIKN